jgi:hypothetical protein
MKHLQINAEVSERLREFVTQRFQARGRFDVLETLSGISASKWKNFFYKKQDATQELINFWTENFSDDSLYPSGNQFIDMLPSSKDVSARLRELIEQKFQSRGRVSGKVFFMVSKEPLRNCYNFGASIRQNLKIGC